MASSKENPRYLISCRISFLVFLSSDVFLIPWQLLVPIDFLKLCSQTRAESSSLFFVLI